MRETELPLTPRHLEILALFASGYTYTEISEMKFLSYSTVRRTLTEAVEATGAKNLTHLVAGAVEVGLLIPNGTGYTPVQEERVA